MSDATMQVIDAARIGRKGVPRHYEAFGIAPPMKTVPATSDDVAPVDQPPMSDEEIRAARLASYKAAFDDHLDATARQKQYDDRLTITTYLTSSNAVWASEARAFVAWRDAALAYMFQQLAAVESGEIDPPSVAEFVGGIEPIRWP